MLHHPDRLGISQFEIAQTLAITGQLTEANEYFQHALTNLPASERPARISCLLTLAKNVAPIEQALALSYSAQAATLIPHTKPSSYLVHLFWTNGLIQYHSRNFTAAERLVEKALHHATSILPPNEVALCILQLAELKLRTGSTLDQLQVFLSQHLPSLIFDLQGKTQTALLHYLRGLEETEPNPNDYLHELLAYQRKVAEASTLQPYSKVAAA